MFAVVLLLKDLTTWPQKVYNLSRDDIILVIMNKMLFLCMLVGLFFVKVTTLEARIYVVSVGIANYKDKPLRLPVKDANALKYVYDKNGDTVSKLITDEYATMDFIIREIETTFASASDNDIVVLFFSGHGYKGGFCAYDGLLSYDRIRKAMSASRARNKMIFADACYAGNMRQSRSGNSSQNAIKKSNVMLFLSSRSTETSLESPMMQNGYFTEALQRALRGGADANRDRIITARELFNYVSQKVSSNTRQKQHPVMWGRFPHDMPVIKW